MTEGVIVRWAKQDGERADSQRDQIECSEGPLEVLLAALGFGLDAFKRFRLEQHAHIVAFLRQIK